VVSRTKGEQIQDCFERIDGSIKIVLADMSILLPDTVWKDAKRAAVAHHIAHIEKLEIRETSVCPYKIASWYGFALSEQALRHGIDTQYGILKGAITAMTRFLREDGKLLHGTTIRLLLTMAANHLRRAEMDDFAIGPNGLYTSFLAAKTTSPFVPSSPA
jgi:hypothetical protein